MIPKTIHYVWFGGKPLTPLAQRCIDSWKARCPDYTIVRWDESNFDVQANPYCAQACAAGKWAFASDYARLWALVNHGGIYMDTDVEVIGSLDEFLCNEAFLGFEASDRIMTGIMGCCKSHPFFQNLLADYDGRSFQRPGGGCDLTTNVEVVTKALFDTGVKPGGEMQAVDGIAIYPVDYFCPKDWLTGTLKLTDRSKTIHHFDGSWAGPGTRLKHAIMRLLGADGVALVKKTLKGSAN